MPGARRTLQYRLRALVSAGRIALRGDGRAARYHTRAPADVAEVAEPIDIIPISAASEDVRAHVRQPVDARRPVGYDRAFLERYRPNETFYLTVDERERLAAVG